MMNEKSDPWVSSFIESNYLCIRDFYRKRKEYSVKKKMDETQMGAGVSETEQALASADTEEILKMRDQAAAADSQTAEQMMSGLKEGMEAAKAEVPKRGIGSKIFIILMAVLVVLGIVRAVQLQNKPVEEEEMVLTNVQVQDVVLGSVELTTPLSGRIQAKDTVNVVPMASGEVKQVMVEVGDTVSAGQTLFTIDSTSANISLEQAQLNVKNYQESLKLVETNLERTRALYEAGAAAKSDLETLENQYESTKIALRNAELAVQNATQGLSYYTVTAPSGGYVTAVNVVAGGLASQAGAAVVISDTSSLELSAGLSEYLISSVHVGDTVNVNIESASSEPFTGTITKISEAPTQGTYTYPITVKVDDPKGLIKAGMFAEVRLISARKENVVAVPSDAVITSSGEKKVVVLNDDGETVSLKNVTVGVDNGTMAEITEGLSTGEKLVVKGQTYVKDGEKVNVVK